jgi:hypothetical protein
LADPDKIPVSNELRAGDRVDARQNLEAQGLTAKILTDKYFDAVAIVCHRTPPPFGSDHDRTIARLRARSDITRNAESAVENAILLS